MLSKHHVISVKHVLTQFMIHLFMNALCIRNVCLFFVPLCKYVGDIMNYLDIQYDLPLQQLFILFLFFCFYFLCIVGIDLVAGIWKVLQWFAWSLNFYVVLRTGQQIYFSPNKKQYTFYNLVFCKQIYVNTCPMSTNHNLDYTKKKNNIITLLKSFCNFNCCI